MEKTIKIGKQEVRLTNNISWAMTYRDQFGHDIISTLTPMFAAAMDVVSGIVEEASVNGKLEMTNLLSILDGDKVLDAIIHMSGFEFVEIINITWAMAKSCDDDIPDPKTWAKSLDDFPVDKIAPEVFSLALKGMVSSKNLKRLKDLIKEIKVVQPTSTSTQSSLPDSSED